MPDENIDWSESYTCTWRVMHVNPETWADDWELTGVDSIDISRDSTDSVPLLETATITLSSETDYEMPFGFYRVELLANQNGSESREVLGTFLFSPTDETLDYNRRERSYAGKSTLYPASKIHLLDGEYAPMGGDGAAYCAKLLKRSLPFGISIETRGGFSLNDYVAFDSSSSCLDAVWGILDKADWCIQIDGDGNIIIMEKPSTVDLLLDQANAKIMGTEIKRSADLSEIPNVYKVIDDAESVEIVNDRSDSPVSTTNRLGMRVEEIDTSATRVNGETLYNYARRQLEAKSTIVEEYTYSREYWPDVYPFDLVRGSLVEQDFMGDLRVMKQSLECGHGVYVTETAGREIKLWEV